MRRSLFSDIPLTLSNQPSAINILGLNLTNSKSDSLSVTSDETGDDSHSDLDDDFESVASVTSELHDHDQLTTTNPGQHPLADQEMATDSRESVNNENSVNSTVADFTLDESESSYVVKEPTPSAMDAEVVSANFTSVVRDMHTYIGSGSTQQDAPDTDESGLEEIEDYKNTPIFSSEVGAFIERKALKASSSSVPFLQFGLVGTKSIPPSIREDVSTSVNELTDCRDSLLVANMNVPWSAFICGSQGAGKSHTLSCILENALVANSRVNRLPNPLAGMVFHYDNYSNASCSQICEAAYLCSSGIPVTVLVAPSNIWAMSKLYADLPGLPLGSPKPKVLPLYLSEDLLDSTSMLKLMAIDPDADTIPFYMETVMSILREMAMEGKGAGAFSYAEFRHRIADMKWDRGQIGPLEMRLQLLDSFLKPTQFTKTTRPAPAAEDIWKFQPGTLTIVDLSDPFVSSTDACALFSNCLSLFLEDRGECGRVVVLDEAHKFLTQSGAAQALTSDLTSIIRQQRHTGTRVLIATQEPTLSPKLIDLCNATFVHRFSSPAWYTTLKQHLAGANKYDSTKDNSSLFDTIVALKTGEALMFCPTALTSLATTPTGGEMVEKLGDGYLRVKIRKRLTADGGRSILASQTSRFNVAAISDQIPMHIVHKPPQTSLTNKGKAKGPAYPTPVLSHIGQPQNIGQMTALSPPVQTQSVTQIAAASSSQPTTNIVRPNTQPTSAVAPKPASQNLSWRQHLQNETRSIVRKNYMREDFRAKAGIHLGNLIEAVEDALDMPHGQLANMKDKVLFNNFRVWARDEFNKCNSMTRKS